MCVNVCVCVRVYCSNYYIAVSNILTISSYLSNSAGTQKSGRSSPLARNVFMAGSSRQRISRKCLGQPTVRTVVKPTVKMFSPT